MSWRENPPTNLKSDLNSLASVHTLKYLAGLAGCPPNPPQGIWPSQSCSWPAVVGNRAITITRVVSEPGSHIERDGPLSRVTTYGDEPPLPQSSTVAWHPQDQNTGWNQAYFWGTPDSWARGGRAHQTPAQQYQYWQHRGPLPARTMAFNGTVWVILANAQHRAPQSRRARRIGLLGSETS